MKHRIAFHEEARTHLRQMAARERQLVLSGIAALEQEPTRETRNLKALRANPLARVTGCSSEERK